MTSPLDNRIPPPIVSVLIGLGMWAASFVVPAVPLPAIARFAMLAVVMLIGGLYGGRAIAGFARAKTTINPVNIAAASTLVTSGIYALSRNPMYVGLAALLVSLALLLSNAWLQLGPLCFILFTTRFQIIPEERVLQDKFGSEYMAYRNRVRRWL